MQNDKKAYIFSKKHRENLSLAHKGQIPWIKGKHHSKKTKQIMREHKLGRKLLEEHKNKIKNHPNCKRTQFKKSHKTNIGRICKQTTRDKIRIAQSCEKAHNWKGGITEYNHLLRTQKRYDNWRLSVFKRDKFRCQNCEINRKLNAHHIVPFSECIAMDYEDLIFDVDNGLTLCEDCHIQLK